MVFDLWRSPYPSRKLGEREGPHGGMLVQDNMIPGRVSRALVSAAWRRSFGNTKCSLVPARNPRPKCIASESCLKSFCTEVRTTALSWICFTPDVLSRVQGKRSFLPVVPPEDPSD
jgi:hypothetical protein